MNINDYQAAARSTALYTNKPEKAFYPYFGLAGEAGEVCEKVKKLIRDKDGIPTVEFKEDLKKELGDVLWYIANISEDLGFTLEEVAQANIDKLRSRKERGVLQGSGDNR
jgi:NTP pyrophosphatase (non-canonical NTP hydrolase)